jgi:ornithine cyclodeaminase/alanine dehydrogenase
MPSFISKSETGLDAAAGVKWVNSHPSNPGKFNLPTVMGVFILTNPENALPVAIMDATILTAARTGAAAAVASRALAKKAPKTIGFIGSGVQARWLLDAHKVVYGDSLTVLAADSNNDAAHGFAKEVGGRAVSVEEAAGADIVCTSTPVRTPVVKRAWIKAGAHINAMGADGPGKQELDVEILRDAVIVIDEHHQATHSGEINVPLHKGEIDESRIFGTLGEVLTGRAPQRDENTITIFDSTGLGVQDVALARVLFDKARAKDVGTLVALV